MSGTDHHHDHDAHAEIGSGARPGYYDMMETAIRELLVEKKLIGADEIRRQIEVLMDLGTLQIDLRLFELGLGAGNIRLRRGELRLKRRDLALSEREGSL